MSIENRLCNVLGCTEREDSECADCGAPFCTPHYDEHQCPVKERNRRVADAILKHNEKQR